MTKAPWLYVVLHNVFNKVFTIMAMCETALVNLHRYCDLCCCATENLLLSGCAYRPDSYVIYMHMINHEVYVYLFM